MMRQYSLLILCMAVVVFVAVGCPPSEPDGDPDPGPYPEPEAIEGWRFYENVDDSGFIGLAEHEEGDALVTFASGEGESEQGVVCYLGEEDATATVYAGEEGLPTSLATSDGWSCVFTDYTTDTVDVIVTSPEGQAELVEAISIPDAALESVEELLVPERQLSKISLDADMDKDGRDIRFSFSDAARQMNIAGCVGGAIVSACGVSPAIPLAYKFCSAAIIGEIVRVIDHPQLDRAMTTVDLGQCVSGSDPGACISIGASTLDAVQQAVDEIEEHGSLACRPYLEGYWDGSWSVRHQFYQWAEEWGGAGAWLGPTRVEADYDDWPAIVYQSEDKSQIQISLPAAVTDADDLWLAGTVSPGGAVRIEGFTAHGPPWDTRMPLRGAANPFQMHLVYSGEAKALGTWWFFEGAFVLERNRDLGLPPPPDFCPIWEEPK